MYSRMRFLLLKRTALLVQSSDNIELRFIVSESMTRNFLFMFNNLAIQFIDQLVYRSVHIFVFRYSEYFTPVEVHLSLCNLFQFFHVQHYMYIINMIKMTFKFGKFAIDVLSQCFSDFYMTTS